jgi:hypothetical protein
MGFFNADASIIRNLRGFVLSEDPALMRVRPICGI